MRYGFVIDNRKCIGCHACTTACKSEHEVPVGVNRTWVKQVEKGEFPDTRRLFSVMRCNHCTDAPCVTICPTEALFTREDGIVDFDKDRCIGCKSCMQACPYDALYIDPETHTAAKCNYCAHRIDIGLQPACVNVCPEQAIISGDMEDPTSEISQLLSRQAVKTRKPEKATEPNLFYIDADDASLIPTATQRDQISLWGSQSLGVGHYAKEAEKMSYSNGDVIAELINQSKSISSINGKQTHAPRSVEVLMAKKSRRVYDTPDKGILWGWEVSAYVWTKAIAAGVLLVPAVGLLGYDLDMSTSQFLLISLIGILFLSLTGLLLVLDLDQPKRFLYVLLRPHFSSWLVKGGYTITLFGGILTAMAILAANGNQNFLGYLLYAGIPLGVLLAIYTAFLFAQAKGRDFWQSPSLSFHMLIHALLAGAATLLLSTFWADWSEDWIHLFQQILRIGIVLNLAILLIEMSITHPTKDAKSVVQLILNGPYARRFWIGAILLGNILPLIILSLPLSPSYTLWASLLIIIGIYVTEDIWVEAPQRISLS